METSLSKPIPQATRNTIITWLSCENLLLTTFMEGTIITNAKLLSLVHGMFAGYWLLRSLDMGYLAIGICFLWFVGAVLLCCKVK